jgi:hypothetical protein
MNPGCCQGAWVSRSSRRARAARGLEPSTFCVAITVREATGAVRSRRSARLCGSSSRSASATVSNRHRMLTRNLTSGTTAETAPSQESSAPSCSQAGPGPSARGRDAAASCKPHPAPYRVGHLPQLLAAEPREPERIELLAPHDAPVPAVPACVAAVACQVPGLDAPQASAGGAADGDDLLGDSGQNGLDQTAERNSIWRRARRIHPSRGRRALHRGGAG